MSLKKYNEKRDFKSSSEPKGKIKNDNKKRFVIQYHQARAKHYDFRLQHNGVLISFAVPKGLSNDAKDKRLAVMVEDHPVDYIDFEGIIPKGNYGAGSVVIYDKGYYKEVEDLSKSIKKGHIKIVLNGEKYKGGFSIIHTNKNNWLIIKQDDEYVKNNINKLPFKNYKVKLASLTTLIPKKDYVFEIKYDGYRMISYVENNKVKIVSRNNIDYTSKFKNIVDSLKKIKQDNFVFDGEIVSFDENGRSDFKLLTYNLKNNIDNFYYVIFDILALNGKDLKDETLIDRKTKLESVLHKCNDNLMYSRHFDDGEKCFEFAKIHNLEGIIAKKNDSTYTVNRNDDWLKIKCYLKQEFIIIGYKITDKNKLISSLLLAYYNKEKLMYVGKVGTGFTSETKQELNKLLKPLITKYSPLKDEIKEKNIIWVKPKYVAEIQFTELTNDKRLRQPSYQGLRKDKKAKDVKLEIIDE